MLTTRQGGRVSLSATSLQTLLDGIASRLDETRETSRYLIGVLVFLGLLGTFYGLLETVRSVGGVIGALNVSSSDLARAFADLKTALGSPLSGMATAFSSSLFGLAGSLVLGFLDLQAGQAQNRFYNDLEEWLSTYTRLSSGGFGDGGDGSVPAYIQALLGADRRQPRKPAAHPGAQRGKPDRRQQRAARPDRPARHASRAHEGRADADGAAGREPDGAEAVAHPARDDRREFDRAGRCDAHPSAQHRGVYGAA